MSSDPSADSGSPASAASAPLLAEAGAAQPAPLLSFPLPALGAGSSGGNANAPAPAPQNDLSILDRSVEVFQHHGHSMSSYDDSELRELRKMRVKILSDVERFSGANSVFSWVRKFKKAAEGVPEEHARLILGSKLSERAASLAEQWTGEQGKTVEDACARLLSAFGEGVVNANRTELQKVRQAPNESVRDYFLRVRTLAYNASYTAGSPIVGHCALNGLNQHIGGWVALRTRQDRSIRGRAEAYEFSLDELEVFALEKSAETEVLARTAATTVPTQVRAVAAVSSLQQDPVQLQLITTLQSLDKRLAALETGGSAPARTQAGQPPLRQRRDLSSVQCFGCHKMGHFRRFCPELAAGMQQPPQQQYYAQQQQRQYVAPQHSQQQYAQWPPQQQYPSSGVSMANNALQQARGAQQQQAVQQQGVQPPQRTQQSVPPQTQVRAVTVLQDAEPTDNTDTTAARAEGGGDTPLLGNV